MLRIGVTGGIGSGKSTICKIFETISVPVYYADNQAKRLMEEDQELVSQIKEIFGTEIYFEEKLQRMKLAEIVFNDSEELKKLNLLVHPAVERDFRVWCKIHQAQPYVLKEAALIFESGSDLFLDAIIYVKCNVEERISRVQKRDHSSVEDIKKRMAAQMDEEKKEKLSQYVILNDGSSMVIPQVLELDKLFKLQSTNKD